VTDRPKTLARRAESAVFALHSRYQAAVAHGDRVLAEQRAAELFEDQPAIEIVMAVRLVWPLRRRVA
jgi:hypothetical protein